MRARRLVATICAFLTAACAAGEPGAGQAGAQAPTPPALEATSQAEAIARKGRSEQRLRTEGVPVNPALPLIESVREAKFRTREEIGFRALALLTVALKGGGLEQRIVEQRIVEQIVERHALRQHLTPLERSFIDDAAPSLDERVPFSWRYESAWVLLWSLGHVEDLGRPDATCDVDRAVALLRDRTTREILEGARLRSPAELLDQADLIYRYHWAVVDAGLAGRDPPAGLVPGVVYERHYALNWLVGYMDEAWDDVSTDT